MSTFLLIFLTLCSVFRDYLCHVFGVFSFHLVSLQAIIKTTNCKHQWVQPTKTDVIHSFSLRYASVVPPNQTRWTFALKRGKADFHRVWYGGTTDLHRRYLGKAHEQIIPTEKAFPFIFRNIFVSTRWYSHFFFVSLQAIIKT